LEKYGEQQRGPLVKSVENELKRQHWFNAAIFQSGTFSQHPPDHSPRVQVPAGGTGRFDVHDKVLRLYSVPLAQHFAPSTGCVLKARLLQQAPSNHASLAHSALSQQN